LEPLEASGTAVPETHPDLEAAKMELVDAMTAERDALWKAGEVIWDFLRAGNLQLKNGEMKPRDLARHRRTVARDLASVADCTANRIMQLAEVWGAFGAEGGRAEDKSWVLHRAALLAAKRTKRPPLDVLEEALAKGWSVADLATLGRTEAASRRLVAVCAACGAKVRVDAPRGCRAYDVTAALTCPVCMSSPDIRERVALGTLQ
jgi:hypothetical protein